MKENLFVYGTLGLGRPNEHILADIGNSWEAANVRGVLRDQGWGAEMGFPGIVLDESGKEIEGFVFTSENLAKHWASLDEFEGEAYLRVIAKVKLKNGNIIDANIYKLR